MDIQVKLKNGNIVTASKGATPFEIYKEHQPECLKGALVAKFNGALIDIHRSLFENGDLDILGFSDEEGKEVYWHSTSHLMAQALKQLHPKAQLAIGPPIANGFYYDIDLDISLGPEDLAELEKRMGELSSQKLIIKREEVQLQEAVSLFSDIHETYKLELLEEMGPDEIISLYRQGDFVDLCRGPHLPNTGYIKYFKLLNVAGAYWHGDENNKMLQRIYGTSFPKKDQLEEHLNLIEEARKRDHRKLGKALDLFSVSDEIGSGLILWHPNGARIRHLIEEFWKNAHFGAHYELLYTPHIAKLDLWRTSGHVDYYSENMYTPLEIDEVAYQLKPMNCPFHIHIFNSKIRSYRELPVRYAELGTVYRYERSGVLHGLLRVRGFTQDDAHVFCRPDQIEAELQSILDFTMYFFNAFGFKEFDIFLSTRPEKFVGSEAEWDQATKALENSLKAKELTYEIDPGEGVFYGPKIDIKIRDALKRSWQCTTIQVDFNNPQRFDLGFVGADGNRHQPIMIHRALLGSIERFFGILIEHYGGAFPVWLAPVQVALLPITEHHHEYAVKCQKILSDAGIRTYLDDRSEKVGYKIREGETQKIPYMLILGDKEIESSTVSVRKRRIGDVGSMSISELTGVIIKEIENKDTVT